MKFAENNKKLEEQNEKFAETNKQLENNVSELKEQAEKFKAIYLKLQAENEKLARVRDDMQEQLNVSCNVLFYVVIFVKFLSFINSSFYGKLVQ